MTVINPAAEVAREAARTTAGRFGEQTHTAPELNLDPYPYPLLKEGLRPEFVDLNLFYRENEAGDLVWTVSAYPIEFTHGADVQTTDRPLFDAFELPLSEQLADTLDDDDNWTSLAEAPAWLRDAVLPSLTQSTFDPESVPWRKARHEQILAEGGYASTYDNVHILEHERERPTNLPLDAADTLFNLPPVTEDDGDEERMERETAAAELSRRAATGVGGLLVDARQLRPGDRVSLAHLAEHFTEADQWVHERYATVTSTDPIDHSGEVIVSIDVNRHLALPAGTRLPTVGYRFEDREMTGADLIQELVRSGEVSFRSSKEAPHDIVERYNNERDLKRGDIGYIEHINPTLDGAQL